MGYNIRKVVNFITLLTHPCSFSIQVDLFCFFLNSVVSKAHWLDEHAGSVCCPWLWDSCCISDVNCGDLVEKKREAQVADERKKVGH